MAKVSPSRLAEYVVDQLESGEHPEMIGKKLAAYLLDNRVSRDVSRVMRAVEAELNQRGQNQVEIVSAHKVTETVKSELAKMLGANNPTFHEVIDKNVVGGVKATSGEQQIDLTVRAKLNRLKLKVSKS